MTSAAGPICLCCRGSHTTLWAKAHDVEYLTSEDEFTFWRCDDCGVLFINPMPADRLREIDPTTYYSYSAPGHTLAFSIKHWLEHPLFGVMAVAFAAFDFLRRPFANRSQILFVLGRDA